MQIKIFMIQVLKSVLRWILLKIVKIICKVDICKSFIDEKNMHVSFVYFSMSNGLKEQFNNVFSFQEWRVNIDINHNVCVLSMDVVSLA